MTQLTLEQRIRGAAEQHARLIQTLNETDYAVSAYQQSTNYVGALKTQVSQEEKKEKNLGRIVNSEYADHKKYRDSHMRRFAFKLSGKAEKFEEDATREEQEWLDAVQREIRAKKGLDQLRLDLIEAERTNGELANIAVVHNSTQVEMDELYNGLFQGPTPDIPEEDQKEEEVKDAVNDFNVVQLLLSTEKQATSILRDADKFLKRALDDISQAVKASTADLWGVGGTFAEMAESSALHRAQTNADQVYLLIGQARRLQPAIAQLESLKIAQQSFMSDVVFDNVFTDAKQRRKNQESERKLLAAKKAVATELNAATEREKRVQAELDQKKRAIEGARQELQQLRSAVFESILSQNSAPPSYEGSPPSYTV